MLSMSYSFMLSLFYAFMLSLFYAFNPLDEADTPSSHNCPPT